MFSVSRDVTFQSSCDEERVIGEAQHARVGMVKPPLCRRAQHEARESDFPSFRCYRPGAEVSSRLNAKLPGALLRLLVFSIINWKLIAELEAVVALDPRKVLVQPVNGVVFVPKLGAVPSVVTVVVEGHLAGSCSCNTGLLPTRSAQLVSPVLTKRLGGAVMLRVSQAVRANASEC